MKITKIKITDPTIDQKTYIFQNTKLPITFYGEEFKNNTKS